MTPHSDPGRTAVQRESWRRLWEILLTPRPNDIESREKGSAAVDEAAAAGGEVHGSGSAEPLDR